MKPIAAGAGGAALPEPAIVPPAAPSLLARARPLMFARASSAALTFAIPLVLARLLDASAYGTYKQFILLAQTLCLVMPFGMTQSLYYFVPRVRDCRAFLTQTTLFMFAMGALAGVGLVVFGPRIAAAMGNPELTSLRWPLALFTGGMIAAFPLEMSLTARGRMGHSAIAYVISDAWRTAALTLPVVFGLGLRGLAWAVAAYAIARAGASLWVIFHGEGGARIERAALREQWRYALPFGAAMAIAIPQQFFHQYAVSGTVSAAAFAVYSVGCFQLPVVDLLYTPTSEVLMVRIAELDGAGLLAQAKSVFREAGAKLCLLFIPLAAFLFVAAPDFIVALFSARYAAAVPIFRIALWSIPLASFPVDGALRARHRTGAIFVSYAVKAAVNVPLVLLGLHFFGILGAILAWALSEAVGKALLLARLPSALDARWHELLPWRELAQAGAAAVAAGVLVELARLSIPGGHHLVRVALEALSFGGLYAAGLAAVGAQPVRVFNAIFRH